MLSSYFFFFLSFAQCSGAICPVFVFLSSGCSLSLLCLSVPLPPYLIQSLVPSHSLPPSLPLVRLGGQRSVQLEVVLGPTLHDEQLCEVGGRGKEGNEYEKFILVKGNASPPSHSLSPTPIRSPPHPIARPPTVPLSLTVLEKISSTAFSSSSCSGMKKFNKMCSVT